jgi:general secretion pathway protein A
MNSKKLLALWGLKWNPFSPELPSDGLLVTPRIDHFAWRVEQLVQEGGFALITGDSGTGKSVALRIVAGRLSTLRDVIVGVIERPQSKSADFYRELGDIFAVKLAPHNRWGGFKALRERWKTHVASSRIRPVLLVDEAQEMSPEVLSELRILSSADFDARSLLNGGPLGGRAPPGAAAAGRPCAAWYPDPHAIGDRGCLARGAAGVASPRACEGR